MSFRILPERRQKHAHPYRTALSRKLSAFVTLPEIGLTTLDRLHQRPGILVAGRAMTAR
ncbi:MAG: hypothetical protein JXJ18_11840 [Rhodobacteraceae bacterium]|nr:hypothetical protein [Paracoccaceae bacterium]